MSLDKAAKEEITSTYQQHKTDTGSTEVQVALHTAKILELTEHFKDHKHDHSSRQGLLRSVAQRAKLLKYLARTKPARYTALIASLGLRK